MKRLLLAPTVIALVVAGPWSGARPRGADLRQAAAADAAMADRLSRARAAMMSGTARPGDLIAELQAILATEPDLAEAHLLLGLAYRGVGQDMLAEAVAEFRQALALDPALVATRYYLAQAYLDLGRAERAVEELDAALKQAPGQMQFTTLLADATRRTGNAARALTIARSVPAADRSAPQARYYSALALLDLERRDEAIAELEALVAAGIAPPDVTAVLGVAYVDAGRADDGVRMLTTTLKVVTTRPDLRVTLARAHRIAGRLSDAERELAQALPPGANREASEFYEAVDADILLETGLIRFAQDRLDEAVTALTGALDLRPAHGPTHRHLAEVYLRQNRKDLAASHAAAARKAGEALPAALSTLAP